jgi:hypothetical protein
MADSDGDGLRDDQEAHFGTDPTQVDTDGDGRSDMDEVTGYSFFYAPSQSTLVYSSPLVSDTDGDGMDDKTEYLLHKMDPVQYPFNPNVWNTVPMTLQLQGGFEGYLRPGATSPFTVTVQNSTSTPIKGNVTTVLPAGLVASAPTQYPFEVLGQSSNIQFNRIQADLSLSTSQLTITSSACGALEQPLVYLPFDEPSGSMTFHNQATLGRYDATCIGQVGCPLSTDAGFSGRGVLFNDIKQRLIFNQSATDLNFSGTHPFSLSVWIRPEVSSRTDQFYIIGKTISICITHGYNLFLS